MYIYYLLPIAGMLIAMYTLPIAGMTIAMYILPIAYCRNGICLPIAYCRHDYSYVDIAYCLLLE